MADHDRWMKLIVEGAKAAARGGEAPTTAVIVQDDEVIGLGRNAQKSQKSGFAHAELNALLDAKPNLGPHPEGVTLYCTLEPCAMCLGAITFAGINRVVYGTGDPDGGAVKMFQGHPFYGKWMPEIVEGVMKEECEALKELPTFKKYGKEGFMY